MNIQLDVNKITFLISSWVLMVNGIKFFFMSKEKLKEKTVKEKNKKLYFVLGVLFFFIGFFIFLFFLIITFG